MTTRSIENGGCRIVYDIRGCGPPVLFIQGVGVHADGWLPQIEPLANDFTCVSFDNRGIGRSQTPIAKMTVEQLASDAMAVMRAEGWSSAHVVGHSLGGLIALTLALSHPMRVRSLSLLCTFANGRKVAPLTWRMIWLGLGTRIGTRPMRRRSFLKLLLPPAAMKDLDIESMNAKLTPLFGHDLAVQPSAVAEQLRAMRATDVTPRLTELTQVPTLILSGSSDLIAPPNLSQLMAAKIPHARLIEYADASHGLPIQWPNRVNDELKKHITAHDHSHSFRN